MTTLTEKLEAIATQISALERLARETLSEHEPEPVDEKRLTYWRGRDRYLIIRPDGEPYHDVPGVRFVVIGFTQRPAAIRQAKMLPYARLWDIRERVFVSLED